MSADLVKIGVRRGLAAVERAEKAEERADALRAALEAIEAYTGGEPVYHRTFGDACGEDACAVCLIEGTAGQALAADDAARGDQ